MEIIEKIKTNKLIDNQTEIQKICLINYNQVPPLILKVNYGDFQINQNFQTF